jgi:hypothetical protein
MQGFIAALKNMKNKMKLQIAREEMNKQAGASGPVTPPILGNQAPIADGMYAQILSRLEDLKAGMEALQEEFAYLRSRLQLPTAQARQSTLFSGAQQRVLDDDWCTVPLGRHSRSEGAAEHAHISVLENSNALDLDLAGGPSEPWTLHTSLPVRQRPSATLQLPRPRTVRLTLGSC